MFYFETLFKIFSFEFFITFADSGKKWILLPLSKLGPLYYAASQHLGGIFFSPKKYDYASLLKAFARQKMGGKKKRKNADVKYFYRYNLVPTSTPDPSPPPPPTLHLGFSFTEVLATGKRIKMERYRLNIYPGTSPEKWSHLFRQRNCTSLELELRRWSWELRRLLLVFTS